MKNPRTGELREVKVGWSWVLLFFTPIFGLPLFLRKLNVWGAVFFVLSTIDIAMGLLPPTEDVEAMGVLFTLVEVGLYLWLAIKGNEMTAKNYLDLGWVFVDPDGEVTRMAKGKWGILS